jgi:GT2 family glycosyltransferase
MFDSSSIREAETPQPRAEVVPSGAPFVSPAQKPTISIVIVVWNAKKYVIECLDSIKENLGQIRAEVEVIIVDNASTDGSAEIVEQRFPEFKLIRNADNLGFSKANNIGIAQASGDYICLVNSDVKFVDDCLSPMLQYLEDNPGVAMIGPKMLTAKGEVARSTMRFPTVWNSLTRALALDLIFRRSALFGGHLMSDFDHQRTIPVEVLNGWFLMMRRKALEKVGLLDPQFFMYGEDVDWCYRFHNAGQKLMFFAGAAAIHYGGASSASAPLRFHLEMYRANLQYWRKHHGWLSQQLFLLTLAIYDAARMPVLACGYFCLPSQRQSIFFKLKRSFACLQWTLRAMTSKEAAGQVQTVLSN